MQQWVSRETAEQANKTCFTIAFIRHPFDRIVSAIYSVHRSFQPLEKTVQKYINDSHVRPQAPALAGLRIDFLGKYDSLASDWADLQRLYELPDLLHSHKGKHRPQGWKDVLDWAEFEELYKDDLKMWETETCA